MGDPPYLSSCGATLFSTYLDTLMCPPPRMSCDTVEVVQKRPPSVRYVITINLANKVKNTFCEHYGGPTGDINLFI